MPGWALRCAGGSDIAVLRYAVILCEARTATGMLKAVGHIGAATQKGTAVYCHIVLWDGLTHPAPAPLQVLCYTLP